MTSKSLVQLGTARRALALAKTFSDIITVRDVAVAAAAYAKAAKLTDEVYAEALEIKRDAERLCGQKLSGLEKKYATGVSGTSEYAHTLETENIHKRQAQRWQKLAQISDAEWQVDQAKMRARARRVADQRQSVTYKNQPGIDATKGNVPLAGTSHLYTVNKLLWPGQVEEVLQSLFVGRTLHACCGKSKLGDVRLDLDETHTPDIVGDAADMPVETDEYDTVLCDPPYNGDLGWNHRLLAELSRVASKRIIFQHWFIPAAPNGRYRKAQEKFALSDIYVWQPKTYFGRAQLVSVFDRA